MLFFNLYSYITAASSTTVIFSQIMLMLSTPSSDFAGICIRIYGIVLCVGVILTEFELTEVVRSFVILQVSPRIFNEFISILFSFSSCLNLPCPRTPFQLQRWLTRGLVYIFVGLLAYEHPNVVLDSSALTYVTFSSLSLVGLGALYRCSTINITSASCVI